MTVQVTGCKDCPFYNDGVRYEYAHYCKHPNSIQKVSSFTSEPNIELYTVQEKFKEQDKYDYWGTYPITPDWCPINNESITIQKEKING